MSGVPASLKPQIKLSTPKLWKIPPWETFLNAGHTPWKTAYLALSFWVPNKFKIKLRFPLLQPGWPILFQILVNGVTAWFCSKVKILESSLNAIIHTLLLIISKSHWLYLPTMSKSDPFSRLPQLFPDPSHHSPSLVFLCIISYMIFLLLPLLSYWSQGMPLCLESMLTSHLIRVKVKPRALA